MATANENLTNGHPDNERLIEAVSQYQTSLSNGTADFAAATPVDLDTHSRAEFNRARRVLDRLARVGIELASIGGADFVESLAGSAKGGISDQALTPDELPGEFGRFEIIKELGHGGLGIVFLAFDPMLKREVALKIPRPEALLTRELRDRFTREAQAAARLTHPNLVPVYEVGQVGLVSYIASAYCHGPNLAIWLRTRECSTTPREASAIVIALADAMQYAHSQGILHRDLKPSNVLLESCESKSIEASRDALPFTPRITDFGLAKIDDFSGDQTRAGSVLGTPAYMAPEQAEGRLDQIDHRTDVYGLGAILYELLTCRPPAVGKSDADTLRRVLVDQPRFEKSEVRAIPPDLRAICLKCLEKDPRQRYQSVDDLKADLQRYVRGAPTHARPLGPLEQVAKWTRRRPAVAALVFVSVAASVALIVAAVGHSMSVTQLYNVAEARRQEAETSKAEVEQKQDSLRNHLYVADIPLAYKAYQRHDFVQMEMLLGRHVPRDGETDLRGFPWYFLDRLRQDEQPALKGHEGEVFTVLYSPDGKLLATCGKDQTVRLWNAGDRQLLSILRGHTKEVNIIAFSPSGTTLASGGEDGVVNVWDVAGAISAPTPKASSPNGGTPKQIHTLPLSIGTLAFSPDGQTLAVAGADHAIELFPVGGNGLRRTFETSSGVTAVLFSHDGERLYFASDHVIELWDCDSGEERAISDRHPEGTGPLALSHNGKLLVSARSAGRIRFLNGETLEALPDLKSKDDRIDALEFSPDDRTLAYGGNGRTITLLDVATQTTRSTIGGHSGWIWSAAFSPDGNTLATCSADGSVKFWDLNNLVRHRMACDADGAYLAVAFSPDSRILAVGEANGTIELWDWQARRRVNATQVKEQANQDEVMALAFSPNGRQLASSHYSGTVRLWDASDLSNEGVGVLRGHGQLAVSYSPDGRTLAIGGHIEETCARFWDLQQQTCPLPDSRFLGANWVRYLDDAPLMATFSSYSGFLQLLRSADLLPHAYLLFDTDKCHSIAVSADGCLAATGGTRFDRGIYIWDTATGCCLTSLMGHQHDIKALCFCPDGRTLASASADGTLRLWDLWARQELLSLEFANAIPTACNVSPDGQAIALAATTPDGEGELFVWSAGVPTATRRGALPPSVKKNEPLGEANQENAPATSFTDGKRMLKDLESRWFMNHYLWANTLAARHGGEATIPTFEERTGRGMIEMKVVVLWKDSGATLWTGPFPTLEHVSVGGYRALLKYVNGRIDLPNHAVAACVVGKSTKAFPPSWTMALFSEDVAERRLAPAAEIGPTDDLFERFRRVHRWATQHGFVGGFPTFIDEDQNGQMHYGVVLIKPGMGEEVWH